MPSNFAGNWKNQNDSTLELSVNGSTITGRFESGVGDDGAILWVDISGRIQGDLITFNALYPLYGTVVSWVGQLTEEKGAEVIKTTWIHVTNIPDNQEPAWLWYSNRIGADTFTKVP